MLSAINHAGQVITLATLTREEIKRLKQDDFFCPDCNEKLIIKAGKINIPHFSHQAESACPSNQGGEGTYHETGKMKLYNWLKQQGNQVQLEVYFESIKQRADLFLEWKKRQIPIEYQCVRLPVASVIGRQRGYQKAGLTSIWILGTKLLKRLGPSHIRMDTFTRHFIHQLNPRFPPTLYYFNPTASLFTVVSDIHLTQQTRALAKIRHIPLHRVTFTDLFRNDQFDKEELILLWSEEKRRFRLRPRYRLAGRERKWQEWLYHHHLHVEHLPSIIYLPVYSSYLMKTPLEIWQSYLYVKTLRPLQVGQTFSLNTCIHQLQTMRICQSDYPLLVAPPEPIQQYLDLLVKLDILERINSNVYRKMKEMQPTRHIEESLQEDEKLIDILEKKLRKPK
ncbi:MAG TPA: competence protein CoiA family protein [Cerasibacillus sp.]|uniref:competence protein CoiA n=1 Tax=Cerasibacillus sp. TaxID=2498711 RepID=UPI002F3E957B